ncbi:hypothetical protein IEQ34_019429 [Dendrobium chrysotoxum]|uniref:Uncharacterized protein n=1 Tax=Dendrobium chrysotoxum TaxID=161865 RepID=A0AAV7FR93_DENCH|nr:hypothetical protein IEQ34_019429 [Dendrobium chrysotoxum]
MTCEGMEKRGKREKELEKKRVIAVYLQSRGKPPTCAFCTANVSCSRSDCDDANRRPECGEVIAAAHVDMETILHEQDAGTGVESDELEEISWRFEPAAVVGKPAFRAEFQAVIAPHRLQPSGRVDGVGDGGARWNECVVREHVIGDDVL